MAIELIDKQTRRILIASILLMLSVFLVGCNEPYNIADIWICDEPKFTLTYAMDENGILTQSEILEWSGETIYVDLLFSKGSFCVYPESCNDYNKRLFSGIWKYQNGDLVLLIEEDFIFDNQYDELVFSSIDSHS